MGGDKTGVEGRGLERCEEKVLEFGRFQNSRLQVHGHLREMDRDIQIEPIKRNDVRISSKERYHNFLGQA